MPEHPLIAAGAKANLCLHDVSDATDSVYTLPLSSVMELAYRIAADGIAGSVRLYFDDGWRSLNTVVPMLRRRYPAIEVVLALVTDWIGRPQNVTWDEVHRLHALGARVAGHGVDHLDLALESRDSILFQLRQTKATLAAFKIDEFVLPYGGYDQTLLGVNAEHRLYDHITTVDYAWDGGQMLRPRLMVTSELTPAQVCSMLVGDGHA